MTIKIEEGKLAGRFTSPDGRFSIDLDKACITIRVPESAADAERRGFAMTYIWPHFEPVTNLRIAWLRKDSDKIALGKSFVRELRWFANGLDFSVSDALIRAQLYSTFRADDATIDEVMK